MGKTRRAAMALVLGIVLVLFSAAFAAAPAQTSMGRTASARTAPLQVQGAWSGWSEVPGNGHTPSAPAAATFAFNPISTPLYLFARGTNNRIYANIFNGSSWSGWSEVSGNGFTPDAPGVVAFQTSKLAKAQMNLFVRGTTNRIYVNIFRAA